MAWKKDDPGAVLDAFKARLKDRLNTLRGTDSSHVYTALGAPDSADNPHADQIWFVVRPGKWDVNNAQFSGGGTDDGLNVLQIISVFIHTTWDLEEPDHDDVWLEKSNAYSVMPIVKSIVKAMSGQILEDDSSNQIINEPIAPMGGDFQPDARDHRLATVDFQIDCDWDVG